jgi:hypothetical protein
VVGDRVLSGGKLLHYVLLVSVHFASLTCEPGRVVCHGTIARRGRDLILMISFKKMFIHATFPRHARYILKTKLGLSDEEYSQCRLHPIYGTGQGSASSPVIWALISSRLFNAHAARSYGATFISPDGSYQLHIFMIGFVDDSAACVNDFTNPVQSQTSFCSAPHTTLSPGTTSFRAPVARLKSQNVPTNLPITTLRRPELQSSSHFHQHIQLFTSKTPTTATPNPYPSNTFPHTPPGNPWSTTKLHHTTTNQA